MRYHRWWRVFRNDFERIKSIESQRSLLPPLVAQSRVKSNGPHQAQFEHSKDMVEKKFPLCYFSSRSSYRSRDSIDSIHTKQRAKLQDRSSSLAGKKQSQKL